MADDNLDAFLDFIDADPEYDSGEDEDLAPSSSKKSENSKPNKGLTFEDVFGSPVKKKIKSTPIEDSSKTAANAEKSSKHTGPDFIKGIRKRVGSVEIPSISGGRKGGLNDSSILVDPFSKLRFFKGSLTLYTDEIVSLEASLKDRNMGIQYVNLMSFKYWYNCGGGKDKKSFWTGGVVVKKQSGIRKSANGNDYTIWEINNLIELDKNWTVFLFGSLGSSPSLSSVAIGSYVDLISPSVMDSAAGLKFSVSTVNQIRHIGTSKDFGYCQSKRKDGKPCTGIVNVSDCGVCIYHASTELKKIHGKAKARKQNGQPAKNVKFAQSAKVEDGIVTTNFGRPTVAKKHVQEVQAPKNIRMSLQDPNNTLKRNPISSGNHGSISFVQEKHAFLEQEPVPKKKKMDLNLDPCKTRHLTEKDRKILEALGGAPSSSDIPAMIAANPNAGGRNFMQYLNRKQFHLDNSRAESNTSKVNESEPITMTRETLKNMQKALSFVKKNGPIKKVNPNTVKRKFSELNSSTVLDSSSKPIKPDSNSEMNASSEEYLKILNAKSVHADLLEDLQEDEYFNQLEKKEAIEKKLLSTFSIPTNAVMCRSCKYVALSQSDFCKEQRHQIRVVKATKRFFKCKDCGNRTMTLDRLPKRPCKNCNSSSWTIAPVGKERAGPLLPSERLSVRGDEEKFLGSTSGKLFL